MKITLEREDLATLLSKAMGYDIGEDDMEIRTDPFEVVIRDVRKSDLAKVNENTPAQQPSLAEAATPPEPFAAPSMDEEDAQRAIAGLKGINESIKTSGGGAGPVPADEPMFRDPSMLGPYEAYDPDDLD